MSEPIDEAAILAEMTAKLEAEGLDASEGCALPSSAGLRMLAQETDSRLRFMGPDEKCSLPEKMPPDVAYTRDEVVWMAQQQPAPLAYLRELVQLARDSGMTYLRTGNLEMKFDPDARKTATPAGPPVSF